MTTSGLPMLVIGGGKLTDRTNGARIAVTDADLAAAIEDLRQLRAEIADFRLHRRPARAERSHHNQALAEMAALMADRGSLVR